MVPLLISPKGLRVLVIGGGKVALRKCTHFAGADITAVSESFLPELEGLSKTMIRKRITSQEVQEMLKEFDLIVAATDDAHLNAEIKDEALRQGLYVNSAHGGGNVVIPSVLKRDGYTVAVSTEGRLPAFPPFVVNELESFLDEGFDNMFAVLSESRNICAGKGTQPERSEFLRRVVNDQEVRRLARSGNVKGAMERAKELGVPS
ncbi:MAG: bifunctional precorrin-2 dehydrogenase/sirohydrochlorin ferrochelatase [Methanomassiliicoccaceae archaeon]|jgi:siroheme synthase-like protein|nr:bifunctional precorrin-2 dehydrogenase/sirohydrochlorin ferrochelatase [Methanomassiliicoccaceae archaeon]